MKTLCALLALTFALPASAAERGFTVTGFDHIRVQGPYRVTVATGRAPSMRASGPAAALDAVSAEIQGQTLLIRRNATGAGSFGVDRGPVTIAVTTHELRDARITGTGSIDIDAMAAARLVLGVEGAGTMRVGRVTADRIDLVVGGSGTLTAAGQAADARVAVRGSGTIDGDALVVADADVALQGSGVATLTATRAAVIDAIGTGTVRIAGPASCRTKAQGSATVECAGE